MDYSTNFQNVSVVRETRRRRPSIRQTKSRVGPMAVVHTKLLFLNNDQTLVNTLLHITDHWIQLIKQLPSTGDRRQPKPQIAMPHYTPLHNLFPVS
jgi:hypothetical protein